jgi:hypothetical protein
MNGFRSVNRTSGNILIVLKYCRISQGKAMFQGVLVKTKSRSGWVFDEKKALYELIH